MKTNYVLIDYENVQPKDVSDLDREEFRVKVFLGSKQTKVDLELVKAMQALGSRAEYIQIDGNGPNAVDFHISFYIGQIAASDANSYFHVVSKDSGFDPLIAHLKGKKILASRVSTIKDIPIIKLNGRMNKDEKIAGIVDDLKRRHTRPRKVTTLANTIQAAFHKSIDENEALALVKSLQDRGYINVEESSVSYNLS